jgi:Poxvirus A22 protein
MIIISFDIGVKNLAVCVLSIDESINVLVWKVISLAAEKEKIPIMNELTGRLFLALDELVTDIGEGVTIDYVILENQPSNLNGAMKSLQMMIYSYFQLRKHWEGLAKQVYLVSASEKLKGHDSAVATIDMAKYTDSIVAPNADGSKKTSRQKKSKNYQVNKKLSIEITKFYLRENPELLSLFCSYKKADDMGDTFLQAVSWLRKHGYTDIETMTISNKIAETGKTLEDTGA